MKTLAAPIASTNITAANRISNWSEVIIDPQRGSDEAAALSVASVRTNIATSESFSIFGGPKPKV